MTSKHPSCIRLEPDLIATATGEAEPGAATRVHEHVGLCASCRDDFGRYRAIGSIVSGIRDARPADDAEARARAALTARLADVRRRIVRYRVFPSPLGNILIARTEEGMTLVEYLGEAGSLEASRLARTSDVEVQPDDTDLVPFQRQLEDYLAGRRTTFDWPMDLGFAKSDFHRRVLAATAAIPYGAVTSYAAIARGLGKPSAVRAVAQALRWNPMPIAIPCHRIIGTSGALTGYAGKKLGLKERLLTTEGVRLHRAGEELCIARDAMYARFRSEPEYCLPTCSGLSAHSLAEVTLFASRECAEAHGLAPCTSCRPDVHPLLPA